MAYARWVTDVAMWMSNQEKEGVVFTSETGQSILKGYIDRNPPPPREALPPSVYEKRPPSLSLSTAVDARSNLGALMKQVKIRSFPIPVVNDKTTPVDYPEPPLQPLPSSDVLDGMTTEDLEAMVDDLKERYEAVKARILEVPAYVTEEDPKKNAVRGFQKVLISEQKLWDVYHGAFEQMFRDLETSDDPIAAMEAFFATEPQQQEEGTLWSNVRPSINFADQRVIDAKIRAAGVNAKNLEGNAPASVATKLSGKLKDKRSAAFRVLRDLASDQRDAIRLKMGDVAYTRSILDTTAQINEILADRKAKEEANLAERQAKLAALRKFNTNTNRGEAIKNVFKPLVVEKNSKPGFFSRLFTRKAPAPAPLPRPAEQTANVYRVRGLNPPIRGPIAGVPPGQNRNTRRKLRGDPVKRSLLNRFFMRGGNRSRKNQKPQNKRTRRQK